MIEKEIYKTEAEKELEEPLPELQDKVYVLHNGEWCQATVVERPDSLDSKVDVRICNIYDKSYGFYVEDVRVAGYDIKNKKDRFVKIKRFV